MTSVRFDTGSPWRSLTDDEWFALTDRQKGTLEGLWMYAWWKDGVAHVGSTGTTFRDAVDSLLGQWGIR